MVWNVLDVCTEQENINETKEGDMRKLVTGILGVGINLIAI
jgi:hypothetical protein